jgi:serine/threonine protein kinase
MHSSLYKLKIYQLQYILKEILEGVAYLDSQQFAHRDIKPSNILVNGDCEVKLADFGLGKKLTGYATTKVVTLWYRAPELLVGIRNYGSKIDVWSVGCVAAELLLGRPLFQAANNETELVEKIYKDVGISDLSGWEAMVEQHGRYFKELKPVECFTPPINEILKEAVESNFDSEYDIIDLIEQMLRINPNSRLSAAECLQHSFFKQPF